MKYLLSLTLPLIFVSCSQIIPTQKETKKDPHILSSQYIERLNFGNKELITKKIANEYYYIHKNGKSMRTLTIEGGPDKFSEGLARTKINGKIGFFNKNLEIVLKPIYDFAFPFHKNRAEICTGCREKIINGAPMLDGGRWKKIDRDGLVIE